jgi:hypothetical protein
MCRICTYYDTEWLVGDHNWLKYVPLLVLLINYNINRSGAEANKYFLITN